MSRRGQGHVYRPKYRDKRTRKVKQQAVWWISYSIDGKKHRESSGSIYKRDANDLLAKRLHDRGRGIAPRDLERIKFEDLAELIRADYRKQGRKSAGTLRSRINRLEAAFSGWRAIDIGEDVIDRYAADRLAEGTPPATVNRELSALLRMFNLGRRARMVLRVPVVEKLHEDNVRKGFVEPGNFAALIAELPGHVKPIAQVGYLTGWRVGELLSRRWRHVDLDAGWLRLEPGETKNGQGRQFPLIPELRAVLEAQHRHKLAVERRTDRIVEALFFNEKGNPVRDFRGAWEGACVRTGLGRWLDPENRNLYRGLLFHDLRRSAVRNLVRAGVPQPVAQQLTGHLTASVFKRYAIVDEAMLAEGAAKLSELLTARPERKVRRLDGQGTGKVGLR